MLRVILNDGKTEEMSQNRLGKSISKAFTATGLPHTSYIVQMIAKAGMDKMEKNKVTDVTPPLISIYTFNILIDLGYTDGAYVYQSLQYLKANEEEEE